MELIPSKTQWKNWKLPSKLTAIGVFVGILSLVLTFIIYFFPNRNFEPIKSMLITPTLVEPNKNGNTDNPENNVKYDDYQLKDQELPKNTRRFPILDGNLYIGQYYASFMLGGANKEILKVAARSEDAVPLSLSLERYINPILSEFEDTIILINNINHSQYIEIEYKEYFYAIHVQVKITNAEEYNYFISMRRIDSPSMVLKKYEEINFEKTHH